VAGAHVDPCVFVHFTAKETTPVGALLANDFGAFNVLPIVDNERSALAPEVKPPTGEPYAGDPPVRFGWRGSSMLSLPLSWLERALLRTLVAGRKRSSIFSQLPSQGDFQTLGSMSEGGMRPDSSSRCAWPE
jgi:hypothetical protein